MSEENLSDLIESIHWDRVFCELEKFCESEKDVFINAKPGSCAKADLEEFKKYSDMLAKNPDGYITYHFHTHENGDHAIHQLDIEYFTSGYQEFEQCFLKKDSKGEQK